MITKTAQIEYLENKINLVQGEIDYFIVCASSDAVLEKVAEKLTLVEILKEITNLQIHTP